MEQIIIEGNRVKFVESQVRKEIPVDQFMVHIEKNLSVDTGILPKGCVYFRRHEDNICYMIEVPATLCQVKYANDGKVNNYVISIPFTQFYINMKTSGSFGNMYMTVTKAPVRKLDDKLFIAPYLNLYSQGKDKICTGNMRVREDGTVAEKINGLVSAFFEAESNNDLTPCIPKGFKTSQDNFPRFYKEWDEYTKKDRFFGISDKVEYYPRNKTVTEMVEVALGLRGY